MPPSQDEPEQFEKEPDISNFDKRELYTKLIGYDWITPWFNEEEIVPGREWELEIANAIRASHVVIICLSKASITKEGYVQKEITNALTIAEEKPEGTIFLVPIRFEDCNVPARIQKWQWVNYFEENGFERLLKALRLRAVSLGIEANM